eukprot:503793_1
MSTQNNFKRKWPVKSFSRSELEKYNMNGLKLYFSDPDRVDFGEMMFWRTAQKVPLWITPNFLTRCGLFFNFMIFLISFVIEPAYGGEMGEFAQKYVPSIICIAMAILQMTVSALDNWDGLHARGTNQCSDLGALLDHYFDSMSTAMNSVAMILLFNPPSRYICGIACISGPLIFHMQLLANHYLKIEPRVFGPEAQFGCATVDIIVSVLFYYQQVSVIKYVCYCAMVVAVFLILKYILMFLPKFKDNATILSQYFMFVSSWGGLLTIYWFNWISTFEMCISGVYIAWDFNGQIVTHDILKETLPIFKPYYYIIAIGPIFEYYYFNPLLWLVNSKNNIHITTITFWVLFAYKNITHHRTMAGKLLAKIKKKNKKIKTKNLSG